jgi:integrase
MALEKTASSKIQRAKRLTPRFYASRKEWVVDLPPDINNGSRGRKFFAKQEEAMRFCANHVTKHNLGAVRARVERLSSASTISGLVELYIAEQESRGKERNGIAQAKTCLGRLAATYGDLSPKDVGADEIETWLGSLLFGTRTIWNHYSQARQFFRWKGVRTIVPVTPFLDVDAPDKTDTDARRQIYTPDEMRHLLTLPLDPWAKCKVVLGGFAGIRTCELARMTYDSIDEEFNEIVVRKEQSKQGKAMRPRSVTLQDAVRRHLPKGEGSLIGESKEWRCHRGMPDEAKLDGDRMRPNAFRHSFASYHLAHFRDSARTAFEMGHTSPKLIYETYANSVSRRDAAEWWAL